MSMNPLNFESIQSETIALKYLRGLHPESAQSSLYRSASRVAASARLTNEFRKTAELADFSIQPLLRYYTVLHAMKTIMYARDLTYPASSSVLQHGISVRRTKKDTYSWAQEFAHVYKEGVLQSFSGLFAHQLPIGSRIYIGDLLGYLPNLHFALSQTHPEHHHVHPLISGTQFGFTDDVHFVSRAVASNRRMTIDEWRTAFWNHHPDIGANIKPLSDGTQRTRINQLMESTRNVVGGEGTIVGLVRGQLVGDEPKGYLRLQSGALSHPWVIERNGQKYIFDGPPYPNWVVHFVVLYSLSALCRYNPIEWSDITLWNNDTDAYLIREYMKTHPIDDILDSLV